MENPLKNKFQVGIIIGRFQVPELSKGHQHIINNVVESHKQVLIILGVPQFLSNKENPLGYIPRVQMIQKEYPNIICCPLTDIGDDHIWSSMVDNLVRSIFPISTICLYGGRNSFINSYQGIFPTFELGITDEKSGTKIREEIKNEIINSIDFRKGIIYQSQNQYPKVFPTVDIAVIKKEDKEYHVLMGKRTPESGWRFPGGFVDVSDESFEYAAIRELHEEIDIEVDTENIKYVGSNKQNDHRYKGTSETISTILYKIDYVFGGNTKDKNELCEVEWILVSPWSLNTITSSHQFLFELLMRDLKINAKPYNEGMKVKLDRKKPSLILK